ncbi:MAG: Xylose isomerase-like barrel [Clostridiales bacterium]|nr:Xylose isomerase-like barrel [Clostridiales bacterium]
MEDRIVKSIVMPAFFKDTIYNDASFKEKLNIILKQNFYEGVEFYFNGSNEQENEVRKCLIESKLYSVFLAGNPMKRDNIDLGALDEDKRLYSVSFVKQLIDKAYFYGSKKMLILSGKVPCSEEDSQKAFLHLVESIKELCKYSVKKTQSYVLDITLEYFNNTGEPYFLVGPYSLALELVKAVQEDCKNFEITFDLSHSIQLKEEPVNALTQLSQYVTHIHLANCVINDSSNPYFGDRHPPFNVEN